MIFFDKSWYWPGYKLDKFLEIRELVSVLVKKNRSCPNIINFYKHCRKEWNPGRLPWITYFLRGWWPKWTIHFVQNDMKSISFWTN